MAAENLTEEEVDVVEYLKIDATELRLNPNYIKFYLIYFNFFVNSLIPFVLLIILNCFMYRTVSQQKIYKADCYENFVRSQYGEPGLVWNEPIRLAWQLSWLNVLYIGHINGIIAAVPL